MIKYADPKIINIMKNQEVSNVKPTTSKSEAELKKIAKKKAKKLAQKLKKKENKKKGKSANASNNNNCLSKKEKDEGKENESKLERKDKLQTDIGKSNDATTNEASTKQTVSKKVKKVNNSKQADKLSKDHTGHMTVKERNEATIFIGNLPINTKRVQLLRLFKDVGTIMSIRFRTAAGKPIYKTKVKKKAGSLNAYVVFENKEISENALKLNGIEFKSNHLRITSADKSTLKNKTIEGVKRTVFVGNLKYNVTEETLRDVFSSCGEIDYIRCLRDGENQCKGVAYVCFKTPDAVGLALELNETILEERPIHVERYSLKKQGAKAARDAISSEETKSKKQKNTNGVINNRLLKNNSNKIQKTSEKLNNVADKTKFNNHKKSEYKGVKVDPMKSKLKLNKKKKKSNSELKEMIKKIAPKAKI